MDLVPQQSEEREIVLKGTLDELATLYGGLVATRRSKAQNGIVLHELGALMRTCDRDLAALIEANENADDPDG